MIGLAVKPVDHATHLDQFWARPDNRKNLAQSFAYSGV
jgi:hypothetical protein